MTGSAAPKLKGYGAPFEDHSLPEEAYDDEAQITKAQVSKHIGLLIGSFRTQTLLIRRSTR